MLVTYLEHVQSVQTLLIGSDSCFLKGASEGTNATFLIPLTICTLGAGRQGCCLNCNGPRT